MSHEIEPFDKVVSTTGKEWHELATHVPSIDFSNSGLNFRVDEVPLAYASGLRSAPVSGWIGLKATRYVLSPGLFGGYSRHDTNETTYLGVVKDTYRIIQNREIWDTIQKGLEDARKGAWEIVTSGSIMGGKRVFVSIKLEESEWSLSKEDKYKTYLSFTSGHDGALALEAGLSNTRIVCSNTFHYHLQGKTDIASRVQHRGDTKQKIIDMVKSIKCFVETRNLLEQNLQTMRTNLIVEDTARLFTLGFLSKKEQWGNTEETAEKVLELFKGGRGNEGKNRYDLFNGFTEYYTHNGSDRTRSQRFVSSEFGWRSQQKELLFNILLNDRRFSEYQAFGSEWLKNKAPNN
ncbi:MAG: DUF932 domain-containing protein [Puniceicoccales bacterium]|jgi:phage/plasmid-like protein (TIGR03299 family)|nr:DUF932 domain-containing protein [Puniceicoccales bacterium]